MKNTRKWLPYFLFILAVTAFFIYYLFPSDKVKSFITFNLNKTYPGINIAVDHVKPAFPPGLRLYNVNFFHTHNPLFTVKQIKIAPGLLSLFRSKINFFFKGSAYTGILEGKGEFTKNRPEVMINGKLSGIRIKEIFAIKDFTGRNISGVLDGNFTYRHEKESGDNLKAELVISDGQLELATPLFQMESITFKKITVDLVMKNMNLQIKKCIINGDQMDGSISGSVTLKNTPGQSYLKLSGRIKPHPLLIEKLGNDLPANLLSKKIFGKNGVHIRIYGTLDNPRFFLN
ncbi:MAG: type II secretion system protein GspN [Thermodesulfobacteriota bacterium]|nr:type II secretion system protein GspN [Thermodesulfobacteriota bacterium]